MSETIKPTNGHLNEQPHEHLPAIDSQSLRALDFVCAFSADIGGGVSPYLASFLTSVRHWDAASIGIVLSAPGIVGIWGQMPAGAIIDTVKHKRAVLMLAAVSIGLCCVSMALFSQFYAILSAQIITGISASFLGPAIVAMSLGLVGHQRFASRVGRNEALTHLGNVISALCAGIIGYFFPSQWIFFLIATLALATICSAVFIRESKIDYVAARGLRDTSKSSDKKTGSYTDIFKDKTLIALAVVAFLFTLANGAMLPLAGQYLSQGRLRGASTCVAACIAAAQFMMIPTAILTGRFAQSWGRKPVCMLGALALPIRGLLFTFGGGPAYVISVQLLDGISAGVFGVIVPVIVADLTRGTGHYNLARGFVGTLQAIGGSFSFLLAGYIVKAAGYSAGFGALASIAVLALVVFALTVPETKPKPKH